MTRTGGQDAVTLAAWRQLRAQALRLCPRVEDAEDLVQETLLAAWVAGRHDLPWLSGVLRRQAALAARGGVRRRHREATFSLQDQDPVDPDCAPPDHRAAHAWLAALPPSARRLARLALHGLSADEIRWILRIEPTAFRQRLTRIRRALALQTPDVRADSLALACLRDPARTVDLQFGRVRRTLKAAMRVGVGLGTHDPDGHLVLIDARAHTSSSRGNQEKGITQEEVP